MNIQAQLLPLHSVILQNFILYMSNNVLSRSMMFILTIKRVDNILVSLSAHLKGGIGISLRQGFNKPLSTVVFYCPQKIKAVSIRLFSMVGCIGESKDSPHLVAVCQPDTVRRPMIGIISSGLNLLRQGITAMKTSVITLIHELKSEIAALRAEIAALKAEKSNPNNTTAAKAVHSVDQSQPKTKHDRIIRLPEALKITGFKKTSFYAKLKQGLFKKIQLSERSVGFFESEIYAFVQSLSTVGGVA